MPFERVRRFIDRRSGIERARERARAFTDQARSVIASFPDSPYQRALEAVTALVTDRDH